jgi:hypothetical protein
VKKSALTLLALCCALALAAGCSAAPAVDVPASAAPSASLAPEAAPSSAPSDTPSDAGDIPAQLPDEPAALTYTLDGSEATVDGLLHFSLQGYSIVYPGDPYICQGFEDGESYYVSPGNYLSISRVIGFSVDEVLDGLRLQEDMEAQAQAVTVGAASYPAYTLDDGSARQFWALARADDVLLIELSYDPADENGPTYRALQLAALDTLTLTD